MAGNLLDCGAEVENVLMSLQSGAALYDNVYDALDDFATMFSDGREWRCHVEQATEFDSVDGKRWRYYAVLLGSAFIGSMYERVR